MNNNYLLQSSWHNQIEAQRLAQLINNVNPYMQPDGLKASAVEITRKMGTVETKVWKVSIETYMDVNESKPMLKEIGRIELAYEAGFNQARTRIIQFTQNLQTKG